MSEVLTYTAIIPKQSSAHQVFAFCAKASDILRFAGIDRIGREENGSLRGFQRPQIAKHIKEIRDYLAKDEAILPNSVMVAFTGGVTVESLGEGMARVSIDLSQGENGLVVDGQQRLSALAELRLVLSLSKGRREKFSVDIIMSAVLNLEQLQTLLSQRPFEEKLVLVRMLEAQTFSERFKRLLAQVRTDKLSLDDITAEVEAVRRARYAAKNAASRGD